MALRQIQIDKSMILQQICAGIDIQKRKMTIFSAHDILRKRTEQAINKIIFMVKLSIRKKEP